MQKKVALISGVSGQTGSHLADYLLSLGYEVHGIVRHLSVTNYERINHLLGDSPKIKLWQADLHDQSSLISVIDKVRPDECYNLAALSLVPVSWQQPILTADVTGLGVLRLLEAIRIVNKNIKFYQASSSEQFGLVCEEPQTEKTPFHPRSPYGVAKTFGHYITVNYRESYGMFACCGIAYNHEGERRGLEFVTRKITSAVAKIALGKQDRLKLGNLDAYRDWSHAVDVVKAQHLILQQREPSDFIISSGEKHSVREFVETAFNRVGLDWQKYVDIDKDLYRPAEVATLLGDSYKIRALGWKPEVSFEQLVHMMVDHDMLLNGATCKCVNGIWVPDKYDINKSIFGTLTKDTIKDAIGLTNK